MSIRVLFISFCLWATVSHADTLALSEGADTLALSESKKESLTRRAEFAKLLTCAHICDERLEPIVQFWLKVFTQISSRQGYIHDHLYPQRIFTTITWDKKKKKIVRANLAKWEKTLLKLAKTPPKSYSEKQKELVRIFERYPDLSTKRSVAQQIKAAAQRLRVQTGQANYFLSGIERAGRYRQQLLKILERNLVPEMIIALPLIESAYNNRSTSHVGAAGMWQFMRATARRYITVNRVMDERRDPIIAAEAAAKLLRNNYDLIGSWPLAITAYNHGLSGMIRAKKKLASDDMFSIIYQYKGPRFRFASRNFFVELLAAWEVYSNPLKYFPTAKIEPEQYLQRIALTQGYIAAKDLAHALDIDVLSLRQFNPHYSQSVWTEDMYFPKQAEVILPTTLTLEKAQQKLTQSNPTVWANKQKQPRFHTIRFGENLSTIADYYGIGLSALKRINNIRGSRIYAGRKLILPYAAAKLTDEQLLALQEKNNPTQSSDGLSFAASASGSNSGANSRRSVAVDLVQQWLKQVEEGQISQDEFIELLNQNGKAASDSTTTNGVALQDLIEDDTQIIELADSSSASAVSAKDRRREGQTENINGEMKLLADPSDYAIHNGRYLVTLHNETLGHYADWLQIPTQRLRRLNGLRYGRNIVVGQKLKLDFAQIDPETFYRRRLAWHWLEQERFFSQYQIDSVIQYRVVGGDNIWEIVHRQKTSPPLWLVQQLNPNLKMSTLARKQTIRLPVLTATEQ